MAAGKHGTISNSQEALSLQSGDGCWILHSHGLHSHQPWGSICLVELYLNICLYIAMGLCIYKNWLPLSSQSHPAWHPIDMG